MTKVVGPLLVRRITTHLFRNYPLSLQDEEQQEMAASASFIDQHYGHLVDAVLVKEDLQSAYSQLRALLERLSKDTHWVPISWVR